HPLGPVRRPDTHAIAAAQPQRQQPGGDTLHLGMEIAVVQAHRLRAHDQRGAPGMGSGDAIEQCTHRLAEQRLGAGAMNVAGQVAHASSLRGWPAPQHNAGTRGPAPRLIDDEDGSSTPKPATDAVAANDAPRYGSRPRPRQGMKRLTPPSRPFEGIRNPTGRERRRSVMTAPPRKPDTARVRPTYPRLVHNLLG